jgi:hypothetical protein
VKVIANCQLAGEYGVVGPDETFEVRDEVGKQLISLGYARPYGPPTVVYETQVIEPEEAPMVRPEVPFRDVHVPDKEPARVAPKSDPVVRKPDVSKKRVADRSGRSGRARSSPVKPKR